MRHRLRSHAAAFMLLAPCALSICLPAAAQQRAVVASEISALSVNADNGLLPGSTMQFTLRGSPNARAVGVVLANTITVPLQQRSAGTYTGTYIVRSSDRIDPAGVMVARVTQGSQVASRNFSYPASFQAFSMGAAPAPANAGAPGIERFVLVHDGALDPGTEVRFRMRAQPGGDAWLDIPGVISRADLVETRPGLYEGTYTIRRRDNPDALLNAVASLRAGGRTVTARVGREIDRDLRGRDERVATVPARDERAPSITNLLPANGDRIGDRGRVLISATLGDEGTGIDPSSVRLRIDGHDVTSEARVTPDEIRYRDDLPPGRHVVELSVRDNARNTTTKTWNFDVVDTGRGGRYSGGGLPPQAPNVIVLDANGYPR